MQKLKNAITGGSNHLYDQLKYSMKRADKIDIIVSFLMESGVKLLLPDLKAAKQRGAEVRILTGNYLQITQPSALYLLRQELGEDLDLRFYSEAHQSFHPKAYLFHYWEDDAEYNEIYIGSSNISYSALTSAIEWNVRLDAQKNKDAFIEFHNAFEQLFAQKANPVTDEVLEEYSRKWHQPRVMKDLQNYEKKETEIVVDKPEPRGAQIEALYELRKTREDGFNKALVVLPTGTGKTLLAAFDSVGNKKILFVAHREEILRQAKKSFQWLYGTTKTCCDFSGSSKDCECDIVFAQVQTLGKEVYLQPNWFAPDVFDYIVIDEFHHAVAANYRRILEYFQPKFLLGITATPERLDQQNIYALCDYNIVYDVRLSEAINKGWLVPFRYYGIYDATVDYEKINCKKGKYDEEELEKSLLVHTRQDLILRHYRKYPSKRALGFCTSKKHANAMADYFLQNGISAAAVHSGEGSMNREEAIEKLETGKLKILFSVDMFNEGLDVKAVDMVLFLRPTESPVVFLQQLGRGLRLQEGKDYLTVLDFIGNYKKAYMIPQLLSGKAALAAGKDNRIVVSQQEVYPDDCLVDFDLELIDLFQRQRAQEQGIAEQIETAFYTVKEELGHIPSRTELCLNLSGAVLDLIAKNPKQSPFKNYLAYLQKLGLLNEQQQKLYQGAGGEFIHMIETTAMTKTYKMPLLLAFYRPDGIQSSVTDSMVYHSFLQYYRTGRNRVDMLQDKSTKNFAQWTEKEYVSLAKRNPVHFMLKSHGQWFCQKDDCVLSLSESLRPWLQNPEFIRQMKDAIDYRTLDYYRKRFQSGRWYQLENEVEKNE